MISIVTSLFIPSLTFANPFANPLNCQQQEAQFVGKVAHHQTHLLDQNQKECTFSIVFTHFNPSKVCPLSEGETYEVQFEDYNCSLKNNQSISGVLVKKDNFIYIE